MREYYVPVFNLTTRKLVVFRQQADDKNAACVAARRRFPNARVYSPHEAMPTPEQLTCVHNVAQLPRRERARFEGRV